jgi:hypothetical protein
MKTLDNNLVVVCWSSNVPAIGKNISTDGKNLYSFKLKIGYTAWGIKFVFPYIGKDRISQTTTKHICLASKYGALLKNIPMYTFINDELKKLQDIEEME